MILGQPRFHSGPVQRCRAASVQDQVIDDAERAGMVAGSSASTSVVVVPVVTNAQALQAKDWPRRSAWVPFGIGLVIALYGWWMLSSAHGRHPDKITLMPLALGRGLVAAGITVVVGEAVLALILWRWGPHHPQLTRKLVAFIALPSGLGIAMTVGAEGLGSGWCFWTVVVLLTLFLDVMVFWNTPKP